jgi:hypothetical protein
LPTSGNLATATRQDAAVATPEFNFTERALNKRGRGLGQRGWNNVPRKQSIIPGGLPDWLGALREIAGHPDASEARRMSCLLLETLVLTGLRFNELATLPWSSNAPRIPAGRAGAQKNANHSQRVRPTAAGRTASAVRQA